MSSEENKTKTNEETSSEIQSVLSSEETEKTEGFAQQENLLSGGGTGTQEDPYILDITDAATSSTGYDITASGQDSIFVLTAVHKQRLAKIPSL